MYLCIVSLCVQVFDYVVDNETHNFCKWSDLVPSYTGTPHQGIPHDAFVHTVHTEVRGHPPPHTHTHTKITNTTQTNKQLNN